MDLVFIVNPIAGNGKGKKTIPKIHEVMKDKDISYNVWETRKKGEAISLAKKAVSENVKKIVAVGGDGTINEVVNGIVGINIILGVVPAGSGNDLARLLKLPPNTEDAIELAISGLPRPIDLGKVFDRYYINIGSIGLDAEIAAYTEISKKYFSGKWAYIASIIRNLFFYKPINSVIKIDGKEMERKILLFAVGNGKYYGGGFKILPEAIMDDGYFDVCIVSHIPRWKIPLVFPSLIKGEHTKHDFVELLKLKKIEIKTNKNVKVNLDGEINQDSKLEFEIVPKALNIIGN